MSSLTSTPPTAAPGTKADARPLPTRARKAAGRPNSWGRRSRARSVALHATLILASAIAVFPVVWVALTSLKPDDQWQKTGDFSGLSLDNYSAVLSDSSFTTWFANSAIVSVGTTVFGVLISASAGYAVSRMRFPGHRSLMWSFLVTQMFPVAVLIVPVYTILTKLHLTNTYGALILVNCTVAVPFCAWMLKGYFDTIPREIDEAGRVDGLTPFGTFWRLVLPLAKPGLAVTGFYTFLTAWAEIAFARTLMSDNGHYTLPVGMNTWIGQFKSEWGLMTAASVLITIPAAGLFFFVQRHLVSGLTAGSTKS